MVSMLRSEKVELDAWKNRAKAIGALSPDPRYIFKSIADH